MPNQSRANGPELNGATTCAVSQTVLCTMSPSSSVAETFSADLTGHDRQTTGCRHVGAVGAGTYAEARLWHGAGGSGKWGGALKTRVGAASASTNHDCPRRRPKKVLLESGAEGSGALGVRKPRVECCEGWKRNAP